MIFNRIGLALQAPKLFELLKNSTALLVKARTALNDCESQLRACQVENDRLLMELSKSNGQRAEFLANLVELNDILQALALQQGSTLIIKKKSLLAVAENRGEWRMVPHQSVGYSGDELVVKLLVDKSN